MDTITDRRSAASALISTRNHKTDAKIKILLTFANDGPLEVNLLALKTMLPFLVCALIKSEAACAPRENANGWKRGWEKTI